MAIGQPTDAVQDGGEEGVSAQPPRDTLGRFLPGQVAYPGANVKRQNVNRLRQAAYVDAMSNALSPDQLVARLEEAYGMAKDTRSWRGMAEVLTIYLEYIVGKPAQRVQVSSLTADLASLLQLAGNGSLLPEEGATVDSVGVGVLDGDGARHTAA